ncbi:hypothetical protein GLOIN_2v1774533 [Rhizophagus irregularis DAOM 181602=DAOM 197198]|nr:hypothetical protein GLOIN_2v1774533 [Rhizophagus irregularis DAOM 181602=DAOM 197198]
MFRSYYVSNISQRSYIRQRYSAFNIASTLNRTNDNIATDSNDHDIIDIYDEDEEMTPTIDTKSAESEKVSEDDIAFESEYERMMEEFNEGDEYEGDRGGNENESDEETSEEASDEEIIDQPLNNEQLPHFTQSNEFNPYFNNITESLFFCWMQKHRICKLYHFKLTNKNTIITYSNSSLATQAYDKLVDIIRHPQFKKDDVVPNSRRFRKYRRRYHSSYLNNPSISDNMYFGPGQEVTKSKEFWHGNIWKESPKFGQASITIAQNIYYSGDFVIYRESKEAKGLGHLPGNLQSNNRKQRSQEGELWFMDREMDDAIMNVESQAIVNQLNISILYDNVANDPHSYKIREILYKHNGHWKIRHVKYSYQHPSEFATLEEPRTSLPIYKLFIDLYYDDFGTFRNVYHSLGGVYIQIGNMPL